MGLPHITSCCWCLGLEMGAKCVAFLHLIISTCLVVLCATYAHKFGELSGTAEDAGDEVYTKWHRIAFIVAVFSTGHVLLAITLLYGVYKRVASLLYIWVCIMCLLWVSAAALNVVAAAVRGLGATGSDIFLEFVQGVLFFGVVAYCILAVYSFYLLLRSTEDMEGPSHTPY